LTGGFLRTLQVGYAAVLGLGLPILVGSTWALLLARRRGARRPGVARLALLSGSCLFALACAEVAAAAWLAWWHRMPALPTRFAASQKDELSVVVLGGSSGLGYPYNPWCSPGQILAWGLERALPGRKVSLDIRARMGHSLEMEHRALASLDRRPDLLVIYAGNNEFLARFEGSRDAALDEAPLDPFLNALYRASLASPLCRLMYETVSKNRLGGPPPPIAKPRLIDPPAVTPSEYAAVLDDFRRRLAALVAWAEGVGAVPVLVIPPGNESGFEPNRTVLPESATKAEREALTAEFRAARDAEAIDQAKSLETYRSLIARQPRFAEAHFRLARLLERAGDVDEARRHYLRARDLDGYPVRVTTDFQDAFRDVAARSGCILIDGPEVARAVSLRGIVDDHLIHDAHHPTLLGQVALARAILRALRERRAFGWDQGEAPAIDLAETAAHFGLGREAWEAVCARSSTFYRDFAVGRYDPSERLDKMRRFAEAGAKIAAGVAPEDTGVPGMGVPRPEVARGSP
jgi:tetratricopeptide (TPR) repeat protein